MVKSIKALIGIVFFTLSLAQLFSADYTQTGQGKASTEDEAIRIAKANALSQLFQDEIFLNLLLADYPQDIQVKDLSKQNQGPNTCLVKLTVTVSAAAVLLTETKYRNILENALNQTEDILSEIEPHRKKAMRSEENMNLSDAYLSFNQALALCHSAEELLLAYKNSSVQSKNGNNKDALLNNIKTIRKQLEEGLARIDTTEKKSMKDTAITELKKTFDSLVAQMHDVEKLMYEKSALTPYYNLTKDELTLHLSDVEANLENLRNTLRPKLQVVQKNLPKESVYLKEKVGISMGELSMLEKKLSKIRETMRLEIDNPSLTRQDRAEQSARFWKGVGDFLLLQEPEDTFGVRLNIPFELNFKPGLEFNNDWDLTMRLEGVWGFLWMRTILASDEIQTPQNITNHGITQSIDAGFGNTQFFWGLGLGWDWFRWVGPDAAFRDVSAKLIFGAYDNSLHRPAWNLSFGYRFPNNWHISLFGLNLLNWDIQFQLMGLKFVQIEAGAFSRIVQFSQPVNADINNLYFHLNHNIGTYASFGIRMPQRILWGVRFHWESVSRSNPAGGIDLATAASHAGFCVFMEWTN